jgi:hypothetical protein
LQYSYITQKAKKYFSENNVPSVFLPKSRKVVRGHRTAQTELCDGPKKFRRKKMKVSRRKELAAAESPPDATKIETMDQDFSQILANNEELVDRIVDEDASIPEAEEPINECNEVQDPSGVLNTQNPDRFGVTARTIEIIAIENLRQVDDIDDYMDATDAYRPLVMRTPEGDYVIDGRNLVDIAMAAGETSISCEVDTVEEHNLTDLCLRKAGIRSQTRGGRARYAELVRNAMKLKRRLLSENSELNSYGHGGRRFGEGFSGDCNKDIVTILELRLSKSRNTINTYGSHSEYVSDEVMATLVQGNKDKKFFEDVGRLKSKLLQRLQEELKTQDEITTEISTLIRRCVEEGIPATPRTQPAPNQNPPQEDQQEVEEDAGEQISDAEQTDEDPIRNIKRSTLEVSSRLSQRIEASNDLACLYNAVTEEIRALSAIATQIAGLTISDPGQEREAA